MTAPSASRTTSRRAPSIPATMRAAAIDRFGPPEVLALHTLPVPKPGPHEVLIQLFAAGVGIWDAKIRAGEWAEDKERFPQVLGTDGAGIVAACGPSVERFRPWEEVWAYEYGNPKGGFYAEYVAVNAEHVGHRPKQLGMIEAGAAAATGLTALQGIDDHLDVRQGETVLIFGASGALGTLAVQFAKRRMARVIGTASGPAAQALVRQLGADHVLDARGNDALEKLRVFAPRGLDAVLALAGGKTLDRCLDLMNAQGRVAYPNGIEPPPRQRAGVRSIGYDVVAAPRNWASLERAVPEARLRVPVAGVYPLEQAAKAHERIEQGHVVGRLAIKIRDEPATGPIAPPD
jgi:NADPH:quinone reductase-like Zn-dependent oxidoreductase